MSDVPRNSTNTIITVLVVAVVVLAAGVGYAIWNNSRTVPPITSLPVSTTPAGTTGDAAGSPMGAATGATPVAFDPKTATKVPEGTQPADFVKLYHEDIQAGKFAEAYKMLPLDKQQSYGDAASYEAQLKAYGITGYELGKPAEKGDEMSIAATQVTPQMPITYTWTFAKVDGAWYVKARAMGGSTN